MNTITVSIRSVYGVETVYPACKHSAFLCAIARTKTLTQDMIRLIRAQGYEIKIETANQAILRRLGL